MFLNIKKITLPNAPFFSGGHDDAMTFAAQMSCDQWPFVPRQENESLLFPPQTTIVQIVYTN